jgi:hypothetical protein
VRVPGQLALERKRHALESGLKLHPAVEKSIESLASALVLQPPQPL